MPEIKYVALDPGKDIGWATFDGTGEVIRFGTIRKDEGREGLYNFLKELPKGITVIVENYLLFPDKAKAQYWDPMETVRVLGVLEFYCYLAGSTLIQQPSNIKPIAYMWAGITPAKNHRFSHQLDAMVHGIYYLQKNGIRKPQQSARVSSGPN